MLHSSKHFCNFIYLFFLVILLGTSCENTRKDKFIKADFRVFYKESGTISICLSNVVSGYVDNNIIRQIVSYSHHLATSGFLNDSVVLLSYYYGNLSANSLYDKDGGDIVDTYKKLISMVEIAKDKNINYFNLVSIQVKLNSEWYNLDLDYYSSHLNSCK
jgi:hypothetical protein